MYYKKEIKKIVSKIFLFLCEGSVYGISNVETIMLTNTSTNIKEEKYLLVCYSVSYFASYLNWIDDAGIVQTNWKGNLIHLQIFTLFLS